MNDRLSLFLARAGALYIFVVLVILLSHCARAEPITMTATISAVDVISLEDGVLTSTAQPVPTDDGSINFRSE